MKIIELHYSTYKSIKLAIKPTKSLKHQNAEVIHLIVSLTTMTCRIKTLHITIRNLLAQEHLPEKLNNEQDYKRIQREQITNHFKLNSINYDKNIRHFCYNKHL